MGAGVAGALACVLAGPAFGCAGVTGLSGSGPAAAGGALRTGNAGGRSGGWTGALRARGAAEVGAGGTFSCGASGLVVAAASLWSEVSVSCGCPLEPSVSARESTPEPVRRRFSSIATSSSMELECVFFSCTPISGSISSMMPGLTSSSRANSLIRIFLIEATAS